MALADVSWGDWSYGSNNGMRVGLAVYWSAVSNTSTTVTATIEIWTGNQYSHNDGQVLTYANNISGTTSFTNTQGSGTSTHRATKTWTYSCTTYGGSPGTATFTATISGAYSGATPFKSGAYTIPGRPYSAPGTPSVTIGNGVANCSGNQTDSTKDKFWQYTDWQLETNDIWNDWNIGTVGTRTSETYTGGNNSRMRARVRARNANATGSYGTSDYYYGTPTAVSSFAVSRPIGSTTATLTWTNTARYSGAVRIARSLDGGAWGIIKTLSGTTTSTTDTVPLASEAAYIAYTDTPQGVNKATAGSSMIGVGLGYNPPLAPVSAALTRINDSEASITVAGNQNNSGADRYWETVEWALAVGAGTYSGGATGLAGATTSIPVSGLVADQRYRARVRAVNVSGPGPWLETAFIYTTPATPTGPQYERTTQVELWLATVSAWSELIRVERSTNLGASWTELGTYGSGRFYDPLPLGSAAWYRFRTQTPVPLMQSGYSTTLQVSAVLTSDKARMPGVTRIYQESNRIRQVLVGSNRIWADGD